MEKILPIGDTSCRPEENGFRGDSSRMEHAV
jgi:hypothetical protein